MDFRDIRILYLRELRCALRERSILVHSIVLQIVLYPAVLWLIYTGISFVQGQTEGFTSRIMIRNLPVAHRMLQQELGRDDRLALRESKNPDADLRTGALDLLLDFAPPERPADTLEGNFRVLLTYDESKDRSRMARARISELIGRYRDRFLLEEGSRRGLSPSRLQPFWVVSKNVATSRKMGQFLLGLMLPLFLIIMVSIGCMYPAIDSTAGEREKSTWETTLTCATSRGNVVVAKYLYVSTLAAFAGILNVSAMLLTVKSVMAPLLAERAGEFTFALPISSIPLILVLNILLALFVAAGMMILASFARNFREGQSLVSPFYIAIFLPVLFLQAPGVELTPALALIPVVNVAMVFREAISGTFRWPLIGITLAAQAIYVGALLRLASAILRFEDYVMGTYGGSLGQFLKRRLRGARGDRRTHHE